MLNHIPDSDSLSGIAAIDGCPTTGIRKIIVSQTKELNDKDAS